MSTFSGLEIGKKALWAQKKALEVTSHNVANANTEGYSRQEAIQTATSPLSVPGAGQMGTGVEVSEVRRVRNEFIDGQVRKENRTKGYWEIKEESLKEVELIFNEPSNQGVEQVMSDLWNSMQELNNKPESKAVRATVRQRALAVTDTFNHIDTQLNDYKLSINSRVETKVQDINSHANRIADLNEQIVRVESGNQDANDLRDKRTQLVNELAKLTNIQYSENDQGALRVSISGRSLVQGENVTELDAVPNSSNNDLYDVKWADNNSDVTLKDGELKGLLEVRDQDIAKYRSQLDEMANALIEEFNLEHRSGYGLKAVSSVESTTQVDDINADLDVRGEFDVFANDSFEKTVNIDGTNNSLSYIRQDIDDNTSLAATIGAHSKSIIDSNSALGYSGSFDVDIDGGATTRNVTINASDTLNDIKNTIDGKGGLSAQINDNNQLEITASTGNRVEVRNATGTLFEDLGFNHTLNINNGTGNKMSLRSVSGDEIPKELGIGAGENFFAGSDAGSIDLTDNLKTDSGIQDIATADKMADSNGDGINDYAGESSNALALAELQNAEVMNSGTTDFNDYYNSNVAQLGVESQRAQRMVDNQDTLLRSLEQQQESVSGVSLDEEMSNMIKYQQSYTAASKIVSTMDQMLSTLVNGLKR